MATATSTRSALGKRKSATKPPASPRRSGGNTVAANANTVAAKRTRKRRTVLSIAVEIDDGNWDDAGAYEVMVAAIAAELTRGFEFPTARATACVALSSDEAVRMLNKQFRGQDKATNVLSFPGHETLLHRHSVVNMGDIILARETLVREAREMGIPLDHHFRHLVVHGLLHLMDYDHETDAEATEMEALETAILARLGIPDPHAAPLLQKEK